MALSTPPFATFADVAVDTPVRSPGVFSYGVPGDLPIAVGQPVWVPFGRPVLPGIVVGVSPDPPPFGVRPILDVVGPDPAVGPAEIALARWIAEEYVAPLYQALALLQPPGAPPRSRIDLTLATVDPPADLDRAEGRVVEALRSGRSLDRRQVLAEAGRGAAGAIGRLIRRGVVVTAPALRPPSVGPRLDRTVWLDLDPAAAAAQRPSLRPDQADLVDRLAAIAWPARAADVAERTGASAARLKTLTRRGILTRRVTAAPVRRDPLRGRIPAEFPPLPLTLEQAEVARAIVESLDATTAGARRPFLLQGVTGSGKTEVYLRALAAAIARGRQGIVLVPEIALTPQMIDRFSGRFPGRVGVLHSGLSRGEHYDEWHRIRSGAVDVVIGSRGAVFAPVPRLGLIVVDEEHEWTYKQDQAPAYDARQVARRRADLAGATVVLGSATPDTISRFRAESGDYRLLRLSHRIEPARLPPVEIIDLRAELRSGNRSIFSRSLDRAIRGVLGAGEQAILFLNRRGAATFVQCRDCGHPVCCRRCDLPLTYHSAGADLVCHRCNARRPEPDRCPDCASPRIKHFGLGTQRLEEETRRAYATARVLRWDRDTTQRRRGAHGDLLAAFAAGEADVLIGTRMIAKGLDLPNVTLVGVLNADVGLYLPDYRAGERTFQLLAQVAGRAGRGRRGGRVIIQTYSPDHYAVAAAATHDYDGFYRREIAYRRDLWNPPFSRLTRLTYTGSGAPSTRREAEKLADRLRLAAIDAGRPDLEVLGPAPGFVDRIRGKYRWQILLRGDTPPTLLRDLGLPPGWRVDVDPASLL